MDQLLGIKRLLRRRHDEVVHQDIVHEGRAGRRRKAEVADLNGRRPQRQDSGAMLAGVAVQIDQDVDAVGRDAPRRFHVRDGAQIDEAIEGLANPAANGAAVVRAMQNSR